MTHFRSKQIEPTKITVELGTQSITKVKVKQKLRGDERPFNGIWGENLQRGKVHKKKKNKG